MERWLVMFIIGMLMTVGSLADSVRSDQVPSAGWGVAGPVGADDCGNVTSYDIAFDQSGNAIAVWTQFSGKRTSVFSRTYIDGMGWGTPELLESNETSSCFYPDIAFDPSGNAIVVWVQADNIQNCVWSNMYVKGEGGANPSFWCYIIRSQYTLMGRR